MLVRFGALALFPIVLLGVVLGQTLSAADSRHTQTAEAEKAQLLVQLAAQPVLTANDLSNGMSQERLDSVDQQLRATVLSRDTQGIKVWNRNREVVYSNDRSKIGHAATAPPGVDQALAGKTAMVVGAPDVDDAKSATQAKSLEVYVPLRFADQGPADGAVALTLPYAELAAMIDADTRRLYLILLAGLALLYAMMFPIAAAAYRSRRRALDNEKLAISQQVRAEEAVRLSAAKSRFLAAMSHELRTPLNSILGFAQLLRSESFGELNERQTRYVGHIESSGKHLLALINDLLDLSKVQAGHLDLSPVDLSIRVAIEDVLAKARPIAEAKGVNLSLRESRDALVRVDARALHQVLWNLLSNAIKFTAEGGEVVVACGTTPTQATIAVYDNGVGIPLEMQAKIFEEFTQVRNSRRPEEGTGLGLALTKQLVESMGGAIVVESILDIGSTFTMSLPLSERHRDRRLFDTRQKMAAVP